MAAIALTKELYFTTSTVIDWVDIFTRPVYKHIEKYLAYLYNQEVIIIDNQDITFSNYPFFSVKTEGRDVKVSFKLEKDSNVWLGVSCPFSGYLNYIVKNATMNVGQQEFSFSLPNKGLYCISMVIDNEIFEKKIVVE